MKVVVIGTSLSGKTTIIKYLRIHTKLNIREIDEEIHDRNNGKWPHNDKYRFEVLGQKIIEEILNKDDAIFFTNTEYFTQSNLEEAHKKGFIIIQLWVELAVLKIRNKNRMKYEGYNDFSQWLTGMLRYQKKMKAAGHIDFVLDANRPTEIIAKELMNLFDPI